MKTISQLKEEIKMLLDKLADVDARCVTESRDYSETEIALTNSTLKEVKRMQEEIVAREDVERTRAQVLTGNISIANAVSGPAPQRSQTQVRQEDRFNSFGEQLSAIINAGRPGGRIDPRLFNVASGLSETVPSDGGFLVQSDFATRLFDNLFQNGLIASRCQRIPISGTSNGIVLNGFDETSRASSTAGGIILYWVDEAAEKTVSKPKFRRVKLDLKKLIGLCYLTDELMMDAPALEASVSSAFSSAFDFKVQDAIINGIGAGQPLGVLNSGCLVSVSKETGQAASTVMAENIVKMFSRRFASQTGNYAWFYNQNIEPQLFTMSLAVGSGGIPIYMPPGGLSDAPYGRLMGLPAYAIEQCPALGTVGDIILANFADGYILAEKGGVTSDVSIHVRFVYDESALRFVLRVDGQPWRAGALTPYKGSDTQSHFIALATRA